MKKILIIEDDAIIASIYKTKIVQAGYAVEIAADGQSGYYRINEYKPDAVLLDLMLPLINGVDILKKIRAQKAFQKLPVIVFTNAFVLTMVNDAIEAGATKVFNKAATSPREIVAALASALYPALPPGFGVPRADPSQPANIDRPSDLPAEAPTPSSELQPSEDDETALRSQLAKAFFHEGPRFIAEIRQNFQTLSKSDGEQERINLLVNLHRQLHTLTGNTGMAGLVQVARYCAAFEALLKNLSEKPKHITPSSIRTIAQAILFLESLTARGPDDRNSEHFTALVMVVDDDPICRRAVAHTVNKIGFRSVSIEDPKMVLELTKENRFDIIFLDVEMPNMNGLALCKEIRKVPKYGNTPVVFVTSLTDFETRSRSTSSGGSDLLAKPFLFSELAVRTLTHVLKSHLGLSNQSDRN